MSLLSWWPGLSPHIGRAVNGRLDMLSDRNLIRADYSCVCWVRRARVPPPALRGRHPDPLRGVGGTGQPSSSFRTRGSDRHSGGCVTRCLSLASGNADVPLILDELPFHLGNPERRLCLRSRSLEQAVGLLPDEQATAKPDEAHHRGARITTTVRSQCQTRRTPGGGNRGPFRMLREEAGRPPTLNNTGSYVLLPSPCTAAVTGWALGCPLPRVRCDDPTRYRLCYPVHRCGGRGRRRC